MNKHEIFKQAAASLRALSSRVDQLESEKGVFDKALTLTTRLVDDGQISSDKALDKLAELQGQTLEDLVTLDKAIELTKESGFRVKLGELADEHSKDGYDSLTSYLLGDD